MEREFREYVKIPNTCPAEDKGQLSKGLRRKVIGHWLSICPPSMVWLKTGLHFLCRPQSSHWLPFQELVNTLTPGWLSQWGPILSDTLVTLSICRLILLLHSTCELYLAKEKQDLWMNITLCHLCEFEFLFPFNKFLINSVDIYSPVCYTWYAQPILVTQSLPSMNTGQGWEGCWHVAISQSWD